MQRFLTTFAIRIGKSIQMTLKNNDSMATRTRQEYIDILGLDASGVTNDVLYDFFTNGSTSKGKKTTTNQNGKTKKNSNADTLNKLLDNYFGF